MFGADVAIMIMYVLGFACTGMVAFLVFIPAIALRKSTKMAFCVLTMSLYEWLVAIESFVWEFITPVETPLHAQYAFIIIGIHLFILFITFKCGGEIGHYSWRGCHRFFADSNL
ncbi:TPA: hypothetical protein LUK26_004968 [Escherichia coli]|nr:hypothetical protein [Escherichia coli]